MAASREQTWTTIGKLLAALVAAGVLVAGLALPYVGGLGLVAGKEADKFQNTTCDLKESKPPQRTTLYANDGKTVLATLFSQNRVEVGLDQMPQTLQDALIATEDRRFYTHHGVDMRGLIRSAVNTTNGDTQGGSTLTMQYVKQVRYYEAGNDPKKQQAAVAQNLNRKIEDAKCAIYIEETMKESKKTILKNYLNIAFFGESSYGIQTAAKTYFNKDASALQPQEAALLVGLLRAPSAYDPFTNKVAAKERRDEVLQNLVAVHKFSQAQANRYKLMPIQLASNGPPLVRQGCGNSVTDVANVGFFCEYVRQYLMSVTKLTDQQLQTGGYRVITTLDPKVQDSAQANISKAVPANSPYTSVLPVVNPQTGNVLAMAASKQYGLKTNETQQPIFTQPIAQAASTFKLFPLLAALEGGMPDDWTLKTVGGGGEFYKNGSCATPIKAQNGDENVDYNINESLRSAMVKSSNTFFVGMSADFFQCRLDSMVSIAQKLGVDSLDAKVGNQTIAQSIVGQQKAQQFTLGSPSASPLEMAGAYAGVANGGKFNDPAPVVMVYNNNGDPINLGRTPAVQAVSADTAARAVDIMRGETRGDGTSADRFSSWYGDDGSAIAGKTGTAQAGPKGEQNGAIWFVGMTPKLVAANALFDFDNPSTPSSGLPGEKTGKAYGDYAAKVWLQALKPSLQDQKKWTWTSPDDVDGKDVPTVTGDSVSEAKQELEGDGFKMHILGTENNGTPTLCPSSVTLNDIAYYGPKKAPEGSVITVCESSEAPQEIYTPPAPRKTTRERDRGGSSRSGGGTNRGGGGNSGGGNNSGGNGNGNGNGNGRGGGGR